MIRVDHTQECFLTGNAGSVSYWAYPAPSMGHLKLDVLTSPIWRGIYISALRPSHIWLHHSWCECQLTCSDLGRGPGGCRRESTAGPIWGPDKLGPITQNYTQEERRGMCLCIREWVPRIEDGEDPGCTNPLFHTDSLTLSKAVPTKTEKCAKRAWFSHLLPFTGPIIKTRLPVIK